MGGFRVMVARWGEPPEGNLNVGIREAQRDIAT
jgi:hypothetical protein